MSESQERKPLYRCRCIDPANIEFPDSDDPTESDFIRQALVNDEIQGYNVYRYDQDTITTVFYAPAKHMLVLMLPDGMQYAQDIPSMHLGLKWWIQEPDIWKEHIVSL